jgi:hypothetical protein
MTRNGGMSELLLLGAIIKSLSGQCAAANNTGCHQGNSHPRQAAAYYFTIPEILQDGLVLTDDNY